MEIALERNPVNMLSCAGARVLDKDKGYTRIGREIVE